MTAIHPGASRVGRGGFALAPPSYRVVQLEEERGGRWRVVYLLDGDRREVVIFERGTFSPDNIVLTGEALARRRPVSLKALRRA